MLFGANNNARLDNFERDHQDSVKRVADRTSQHESTWMNKLEGTVDYMDAVKATVHKERHAFQGGSVLTMITIGVCH